MKVRTLLYCFLGILLLVLACSEHTVQPPAELANGRVTGTVHGLVYDNTTQSLFGNGDVTVTWVADGATHSTETDSIGYYIITDLPPGDYTIHFINSNDYAVGQIVVHVPTLEEILYSAGELGGPPPTDKDYDHTISEDITLYKKNAGIQGTVYKKESENSIIPADGVTVIADHDGYHIHPDSYSTTTNSSGFFSFDSLPSTPDVSIVTLPYNDDTNEYACTERTESLCRNQTRTMQDIILPINSPEPFITQSNFINVSNFSLTEDLTCTFSKTMQTSNFEYNLSHNSTDVECETTWSNDITLTIDPGVDLVPDETYTLHLKVKSADNHVFEDNISFHTQKGIKFVSTNLERIEGVFDKFPVDQDILLTFSMAVNIHHPDLVLYIEDPNDSLLYLNTPTLSNGNRTITLSHPNDLEPEQDYTLYYNVFSTIPGDSVFDTIHFKTASSDQVPGKVTGFTLTSPNANSIDWNTTTMTFRWNTVEGADGYAILAEDSYHNSDRILIGREDDYDYMVRQSKSITLPSDFDYYEDDFDQFNNPIQTPFLNGTEVTFYIVAANDAGVGPLSNPITLSDETAPSFISVSQSEPADNDPGSIDYITVDFQVSEYILNDVICNFKSDTLLSSPDFSYDHDVHYIGGGTITITIPANTDARGQELDITCEDTNDHSVTHTHTLW